ncbi:MAG: hypothetical protein ACRC2V_01835 [Xenococcaceae cyanobacterium]
MLTFSDLNSDRDRRNLSDRRYNLHKLKISTIQATEKLGIVKHGLQPDSILR